LSWILWSTMQLWHFTSISSHQALLPLNVFESRE
jgi:hypothetical protein